MELQVAFQRRHTARRDKHACSALAFGSRALRIDRRGLRGGLAAERIGVAISSGRRGPQVDHRVDARAAIDYIREHREALAAIPAFFYSVGGRGVFEHDADIQRMRRTGWQPSLAATFADAGAVQLLDVRAFAQQVADEIPALRQPSLI